jgi:hypothetical protein
MNDAASRLDLGFPSRGLPTNYLFVFTKMPGENVAPTRRLYEKAAASPAPASL